LDKNGNLIKEERISDCGNVTIYYNTDGSVDHTTESPDREKFRKEARQFAYDRLRISGSGINFIQVTPHFFVVINSREVCLIDIITLISFQSR
jgi:hypothetical protein